ncbi:MULTISPECIES: hypothetical protein [unclassified Fusibacter]|uniref:hypothetical protein n=1 Tax=unclassified Fusibacter TaxID=2624464 RepID=UPI0010104C4F|nr:MULTISPECIES: hypothetical protein [unclassified Fusibacter]MCK8061649.1 hypothetical protein [Fusibacter sp. A2]NPE23833.1 hypothetical protein [Fusibacter sp. A1]RXV58606.1 hypothetical protein DWB64_18780 [Fusibacter sp. A1]
MLEVVRDFQTFMVGHQDKFCCEDCDLEDNCMNLYKAKKLLVELDAYEREDFMHLPKDFVGEAGELLVKLQECAWQRCDCRSRY